MVFFLPEDEEKLLIDYHLLVPFAMHRWRPGINSISRCVLKDIVICEIGGVSIPEQLSKLQVREAGF